MSRLICLIAVLVLTTACTRPSSHNVTERPEPAPQNGISISGDARIGVFKEG